jgi:hypothetical protein
MMETIPVSITAGVPSNAGWATFPGAKTVRPGAVDAGAMTSVKPGSNRDPVLRALPDERLHGKRTIVD